MGTKKRADRRTEGLIPEIERPADQRYANRENRPWTPAQEAVAVAAICACRNYSAYALMAPRLLKAIGHEPIYSSTAKPSMKKHRDTCIRALELRVCTMMLGQYNGWVPPAVMGFHYRFKGKRISHLWWGEKVKILRPYFRRVTEGKPTIYFGGLLQMLADFEPEIVGVYLQELCGPKFVDPEETDCGIPVYEDTIESLSILVHTLDRDLKDGKAMATQATCDEICRLMMEGR